MQRTNILRDIDEDVAAGRVYLAQETVSASAGRRPGARAALLRDQIARADALYERGDRRRPAAAPGPRGGPRGGRDVPGDPAPDRARRLRRPRRRARGGPAAPQAAGSPRGAGSAALTSGTFRPVARPRPAVYRRRRLHGAPRWSRSLPCSRRSRRRVLRRLDPRRARAARSAPEPPPPAARAARRRALDPARAPRRRLLRRAAGRGARRARDRLARPAPRGGCCSRRKPYAAQERPVLPAMELIAVDRQRRRRARRDVPHAPARRRHRPLPARGPRGKDAAGARHPARALGLLHGDDAPARSGCKEPDVGLALDPEWRVTAGAGPGAGDRAGRLARGQRTSAWLAQLVARYELPEKLFIVHQFTDDMVDDTDAQARAPGSPMVLNADGFGDARRSRSEVPRVHAPARRASTTASSSSTRRTPT